LETLVILRLNEIHLNMKCCFPRHFANAMLAIFKYGGAFLESSKVWFSLKRSTLGISQYVHFRKRLRDYTVNVPFLLIIPFSQEHNIKKEESAGCLTCTGSVKCSKLFQNQEALREHVAKCHDKSVKGKGSFCDNLKSF
jgi:hypothetical protein